MKKFLASLLTLAVLLTSMGVYASVEYSGVLGYETAYSVTDMGVEPNHVSAWANYLFVSTTAGLEIFDINTDEHIATWKFTNSNIPSVGNSFKPAQTIVTDDYIIISSATANQGIAVFPNEGSYSDEIPALIRRIGVFYTIPQMIIDGDYLYAVDRVGPSTLNGSNGGLRVDPNTVVCWKINISEVNNFTYATTANGRNFYSILNHRNMLNGGYAQLVEIGVRDNLWTDIETDGEYVYIVTSNGSTTVSPEPYGTLFADRIKLEDFSYNADEQCVLEETYATGMLLELALDTTVTEDEMKALTVYKTGEEDGGYLVSEHRDNHVFLQITPNTAGGSTVKLCITAVGDIATKLGCTEDELKNGDIIIAAKYDDIEYEFTYNESAENRKDGAFTVGNSTLYAFTNKGLNWLDKTDYNYMIVCEINDSGLEYKATNRMPQLGGYTLMKDAVIVNNELFGLYKDVKTRAYVKDITEFPVDMNVSRSLDMECGIHKSEHSEIILHGNRAYYPANNNCTAGIFTLEGYGLTANVKDEYTSLPIYLHGEALTAETVTIEIDGISCEVSSHGGVWGVPVYQIANGEHTVVVSDGIDTVEETFNVTTVGGDALPTIFGKTEESVTLTDDPVNNIITISGTSLPNMPVSYELTLDGTEKATGTVTCDENGEYETTYDYSGDILTPSSKYEVSATTMIGETTAELGVYDPAALTAALDFIKNEEEVANAGEFKTYIEAEDKADLAKALGLTIGEGSTYAKLNSTNKTTVMTEVYNLIKADRKSEVKATFESKVSTTYASQRRASALSEINSAKTSTLKGILEEYKSEYGISDTLWTKYLNNEDDWGDINKYFIEKSGLPLSSESDVATKLDNAIDNGPGYYTEDEEEDYGDSFSGGGGGGSYKTPTEIPVVLPEITLVTFADVPSTHWGYKQITSLATRGVIAGTGTGNFSPDMNVTREQFIKMLVEAFGFTSNGGSVNYSDVNKYEWYYSYIETAANIGLAEGYDGKFGIGDELTREQMATMLYRAAKLANITLNEVNGETEFKDNAEIADYAVEAMNKLSAAGIISGTGNNKCEPKGISNRAMAAKVIYELTQLK